MSKEKTSKEKMIVVERSQKWWITLVAGTSLAFGLVGGFGLGAVTAGGRDAVQANFPGQNQESGMRQGPGQGNMPPEGNAGQAQGESENGTKSPQNGQNQDNSKSSKPSNADGSTKSSDSSENNNSNTTNS